jgi:Na+-transporting NADH:ubiquinone oxidoreductase subunit NqrC
MKNLIKSRRGIAIEMAIVAMFIMMALSIVLVSISASQTRHIQNDLDDFDKKVEVYRVTDLIEEDLNDGTLSSTVKIDDTQIYNINKVEETNVYTVTKDGNTILTFTVGNDGKTITSWRD